MQYAMTISFKKKNKNNKNSCCFFGVKLEINSFCSLTKKKSEKRI